MAQRLLGKEVNASLTENIKKRTEALKEKGVIPTLGIVRVGERPEDISYERGAVKRCESLGVAYERFVLEETVSTKEVLNLMDSLNKNKGIHGVLLFRPLPKHLDQVAIEEALSPEKDVDCMTRMAMYGVFAGQEIGYPPCTAQACMEILHHYGIDCKGKNVVVIGRSLVIGKPVAMILLKENATVTICHTKTKDMESVVKQADIVIVAAGRAGVVDERFVREGQIIIDVGINVDENGKLCGDVAFSQVEPVVEAITPVPGGVGAVTTSVLIGHVVSSAEKGNHS